MIFLSSEAAPSVMDGGSCHWEPVPRAGKFLQPWRTLQSPIHSQIALSLCGSLRYLSTGWIYRARWACGGADCAFLSLPVSGFCCVVPPHVDQSTELTQISSTHLASSSCSASHCPGGTTLKSRAAGCSSFHLLSFPFYSHRCLSVPLPTPSFYHLPAPELSVPGSAWAGIFYHPALFYIRALIITFCSFWIPVAPAGINHWSRSRNSALEHRFPLKGCW